MMLDRRSLVRLRPTQLFASKGWVSGQYLEVDLLFGNHCQDSVVFHPEKFKVWIGTGQDDLHSIQCFFCLAFGGSMAAGRAFFPFDKSSGGCRVGQR